MRPNLISPKEAAEALGVSQSSVKRWCDQGKMPAIRTAGGHRKIAIETVLDFAREQGISLRRAELLGVVELQRTHTEEETLAQLITALREDDEALCGNIIISSFADGMELSVLFDDLVGPAMTKIGELWHEGDIGVDQERRSCQLILRALQRLESSLTPPDTTAPLAIGGTPEGDFAQIGTRMAELILRKNGWQTRQLGAGLPIGSLANACRRFEANLLWLSIIHLDYEERFVKEYLRELAPLHEAGLPIVIGGRDVNEALREKIPHSFYGSTMSELNAYCRGIPKVTRTA